jgi:hypothetical protein
MVTHALNLQALAQNPELLEQLLEDGETIVGAIGRFVETIRVLKTPIEAPAPVAAPVVPAAPVAVDQAPAAPIAAAVKAEDADVSWMKTDHMSMENYDAEQLVAVRKALAAGLIEDVHGIVSAVLERRLGSSKP